MFKTDGGRRQAGVYENRVYSNYGMWKLLWMLSF